MDVVVRSAVPRVFGKVLLGIALGLTPLATAALARVIILSATIQVVFQAASTFRLSVAASSSRRRSP